jgi:hypothetical protein
MWEACSSHQAEGAVRRMFSSLRRSPRLHLAGQDVGSDVGRLNSLNLTSHCRRQCDDHVYIVRRGKVSVISRLILNRSFLVVVLASAVVSSVAEAQTWIQLTPSAPQPTVRIAVAVAYNTDSNRLILFGGYPYHATGDQRPQNDLWILSGANGIGSASWSQAIPSFAGGSPSPRYSYSATYDQATNRMTMYGGSDGLNVFDDLWILRNADGTSGVPTWQQIFPSGAPPQRNHHRAVYDAASNRMIVFGGFSTHNCPCAVLNDVWVLTNANGAEATTPTWTQLTPVGAFPAPRSDFVLAYDPNSNRLILFGGAATSSLGVLLNDVWVLTNANGIGDTPAWLQITPLGPLLSRAYAYWGYDPEGNRLVVFGGLAQLTPQYPSSNDTWALTHANGIGGSMQWQQLSASETGPIGRNEGAAAYDSTTNRLIVFGGEHHELALALNDTWVLTNANGSAGAPFKITQVLPANGGNAGTVSVRIIGDGLQTVERVLLSAAGHSDIVGLNTRPADSDLVITTLNLQGAQPGIYDLVVGRSDGSVLGRLSRAFTVESGGAADLWVDVIGRDRIRVGGEQTYYVLLGNRGNIDSGPTSAWASFPADLTWRIGSGIGITSGTSLRSKNTLLSMDLPAVAPGGVVTVPLVLGVRPESPLEFRLRVWTNEP